MKKGLLCALLLGTAVAASSPALAWDAAKQKNLGSDHIKMQWYLLDYGKKDNVPFAVARKYYTNTSVKQQTVDLLMSKYNLSPEVAGRCDWKVCGGRSEYPKIHAQKSCSVD